MHLYLASSHIPEMANLSEPQRRFVNSQCFFWLFRRNVYRLGSFGITFGSILLATYAADRLKWGFWESAALTGTSILVLGNLYDVIWIAHWRPEVARFIQLHAAEIEA